MAKQLGWKDIQDPSHAVGQHQNQEQSEREDTAAPKLPLLLVTKEDYFSILGSKSISPPPKGQVALFKMSSHKTKNLEFEWIKQYIKVINMTHDTTTKLHVTVMTVQHYWWQFLHTS